MKWLLCGLIVLLICTCSLNASAQIQGDTLQGVEVRSRISSAEDVKISFQPGAKIVGIDSALLRQYQQQSVATLLSQVSSVFIKSYGFNSLATLSFRGASSAQSAVYWEGVPLMNAATGIADVSLIPVAFSDSVSIQYGSSGALGGSGNVGGALLLQSAHPAFSAQPEWRGAAQIGWGSYHQASASAEIGFTSGRLSLRARGVYTHAANDFTATDEYGRPFNTENAALRGEGVVMEAAFKADKRNLISFHAWQQAYNREIPRALFEASSTKVEDDGALRFLLDWKHTGDHMQMYTKAAFLQDRFQYNNPAIKESTGATTDHYFGEWGLQGRFDASTSWLVFTPLQYMRLDGNNEQPHQFRSAIAGNLKRNFLNDRLTIAANGRAELFDDKLIGLPGVGANYQLTRLLTLRASAQRSYRAPTLNELYYDPGGNKDLKPETGWSTDGGYTFSKKLSNNLFITHGLAAYNRNIRDWIIWLGGSIWTPHNLAAVHSRGLETENELVGRNGNLQWRLSLSAAYTRSTPTESYLTNDNSIGHQIPYTPRFTGSAIASGTWRGATLTYVQSYAGTRYITADESAGLAPYTTGNVLVSYTTRHFGPHISINASVQNIWNSRYAVVAYRPMPGINYLIGILLISDYIRQKP
jgi:vitamin B12 transporter